MKYLLFLFIFAILIQPTFAQNVTENIPVISQNVTENIPVISQNVTENIPVISQNVTENIPVENTSVERISADGTIKVQIDADLPKIDSTLVINLKFIDTKTGNNLSNVNYDLAALQNGEVVLSQLGLYTQNGIAQHITSTLSADNHVDIIVILQGIGENSPYYGPQGEVLEARVVPEFGSVAIIVLAIITLSTIIFHKTKLSIFRI